ncbi:MAG: L,D-transpeptidase family protein [Pseudomonadota bacterium]
MWKALIVVATLALAGCSGGGQWVVPDGHQVTQLYVSKSDRKLYLLSGEETLKVYDIELGFEPEGHKTERGDGKTPEGLYFIDRRNPESDFHLSLGISYPNTVDRANAKSNGVHPGGDIFIHGQDPDGNDPGDWTAGCIAVSNADMEEIFAAVQTWTPIYIVP